LDAREDHESILNEEEKKDVTKAYNIRLFSTDRKIVVEAARKWCSSNITPGQLVPSAPVAGAEQAEEDDDWLM